MAIDWDAVLLSPVMGIFGEGDAADQSTLPLYTPRGATAFRLADAVFDRAYADVVLEGEDAGSTTKKPCLGVRLARFLDRPPLQNDVVFIPSVSATFVVKDVQPDGHGHAKLILQAVAGVTSSTAIADMIVAAIVGPRAADGIYATDAGADVFRPGDWPTQEGQYPRLKVRVIRETRQSISRSGPPEFIVTTTVRIIGEVSEPAQLDDRGATEAEAALWRLAGQVDRAVIGSYPLTAQIQQIASIDSQLSYNAEGETHLAGVQSDIAVEWYQGPEAFAPVEADDVGDVALDAEHYPPAGFASSLRQELS